MTDSDTTSAKVQERDGPLILVTGFGPFEEHARNPSGELAEKLNGQMFAGVRIVGLRTEVCWREAWNSIYRAVRDYSPDCLLCLGLAPEPLIRLELLAKNVAFPCEDAKGQKPDLFPMFRIANDAPAALWTSLPVEWLRDQFRQRAKALSPLRAQGTILRATISSDAGYYLCNYVFFHAMHFLGDNTPYRGFVHIPPFPVDGQAEQISSHEITEAVEFLVQQLAMWVAEMTKAHRSPNSSPG